MRNLAFRSNGKPRGWVRRLLFDGKQPKLYAKRFIYHKSGQPRAKFKAYVNGEFDAVKDPSNDSGHTNENACFVVHAEPLPASAQLLIFVVYAPSGRLSELQRYQLACYKTAGFSVVLVANSVGPFKVTEEDIALCDIILSRPNEGFDFSAWAHAIRNIGGLDQCESVSFTNDSIVPVSPELLKGMVGDLNRRTEDILFQTHNNEVRPHFQSYFLP